MTFNLNSDESGDECPELFRKSKATEDEAVKLTKAQLERMDKNRKRALEVKRNKENEAKLYVFLIKDSQFKFYFTLFLKLADKSLWNKMNIRS